LPLFLQSQKQRLKDKNFFYLTIASISIFKGLAFFKALPGLARAGLG